MTDVRTVGAATVSAATVGAETVGAETVRAETVGEFLGSPVVGSVAVGSAPWSRHIVLVGMMASGKTTVGRFLAAQLDRQLLDLDSVLVEGMGMSISEAFDLHGEAWFRSQESAALVEVLRRPEPTIVSPGGGVVLAARNREVLKRSARNVWLRATPETIIRRVGSGSGRPLLAGNTEDRVRRIDAERRGLYAEVATVVVDVDDLTTPQIAECIRAAFHDLC